ncbi:MAG: hypothetical protein AAF517_01680 [Planctomycetota bacterium]
MAHLAAPRPALDPSLDPNSFDPSQDEYEETLAKPGWLTETPFWAVSAVLHLVLILVIMAIPLFTPAAPQKEHKILQMKTAAKKKPPYDPTRERDIKRKPKILDPSRVKRPTFRRNKIDDVVLEKPKGDPEKFSDFLRKHSVNAAIGVGGAASGAIGERNGKGSLVREGGDGNTESAVLAALKWLRRHQDKDGKWSATGYQKHGKNRNEDFDRYGEDTAFEEHNVGVTALSMLAFTGYGQTHRDGDHPEFVEVLRKATQWMKSQQQLGGDPETDGRFGNGDHEQWIYDHAVATMAMAELLVMSNDVIGLKKSVKRAVQLILRFQNEGLGWRYERGSGENDTSVTGWMVLALKTAKNARLGIPKKEFDQALAGALNWFERATASNGKCGYFVPGDEGSRLAKGHTDPYPYSKDLSCMTAVGVLCRLFGGERRTADAIKNGVKILLRQPPRWNEQKGRSLSKINFYYWYYGTYAMFQYGGKEWRHWNERMQQSLLKTQRQGNIQEDGSWDPIGEWGIAGGRVYATALGAMTLEVYYRFVRHGEGESY